MSGEESPGGRVGATLSGDGSCRMLVWAPAAGRVEVVLGDPPVRREVLRPAGRGYHEGRVEGAGAGSRYRFVLDGGPALPDPASRAQHGGVHGPSVVVDPSFGWTDGGWPGVSMEELVLYELHVGTFTAAGDFAGVIPHLPALADLGVTALELMPVAAFPGMRNWGYDGVFPGACQEGYGGLRGLQELVDACHAHGLGVFLDVVYNHLGPEGNVLGRYGPYFTDHYRTPWGEAVNFDGRGSDEVRRLFVENATMWVEDVHVDGLRLDAVHAIHDRSALPFLEELAGAVHAAGARRGFPARVVSESDLGDPRLVVPAERGGAGHDGMWCDDLHHALHAVVTGERGGYYLDFGGLEPLARAWEQGMAYTGQYSRHRGRRHGRPPRGVPPWRVVACAQNHDQVGNRRDGDRLAALTDRDRCAFAAAVVLLSPCTPLLFMGEEWGETRPFLYFTSHGDPDLVAAVRRGRAAEFTSFGWEGEPPEPQDPETFARCVLDPGREAERDGPLRRLYRELLRLRRGLPAGAGVEVCGDTLIARRGEGEGSVWALFHAAGRADTVEVELPVLRTMLDTRDEAWGGDGASRVPAGTPGGPVSLGLGPWQCVVLRR